MVDVALTSVAEGRGGDATLPLGLMRRCARADRFGVHRLVDDPRRADVILFVEYDGGGRWEQRTWLHPLVRRAPERCFAFNARDVVWPVLPGIYASLSRERCDPRRHRGGHYVHGLFRDVASYRGPPRDVPLLASFRGNLHTHRVRHALRSIASPRIVVEGSQDQRTRRRAPDIFHGYAGATITDYFALLERSAFALCPRGQGASSIRLFEAMQLGRAPVIIADDWVEPTGPDWSSFSLRVAERDVACIPALLRELEPRAAEMGERARAEWETWFSEEVTFHRTIEQCLELGRQRGPGEELGRTLAWAVDVAPQVARYYFWRLRVAAARRSRG